MLGWTGTWVDKEVYSTVIGTNNLKIKSLWSLY
jgi:hypothetical protein